MDSKQVTMPITASVCCIMAVEISCVHGQLCIPAGTWVIVGCAVLLSLQWFHPVIQCAELLPRVRSRRPPKPIALGDDGPQQQRKSARQLHPGGSVCHCSWLVHSASSTEGLLHLMEMPLGRLHHQSATSAGAPQLLKCLYLYTCSASLSS